MDELLVMFYTVELLKSLETIHAAGIIHGDIKPDNLFLRSDDRYVGSGAGLSADGQQL